MKFTTKTTQFKKILDIAKKFIPKKGYLPSLCCVQIKAENNCIIVRSTDMEHWFSLVIKNQDIQEEWWVLIELNELQNFLKYARSPEINVESVWDDGTMITSWDDIIEFKKQPTLHDYVELPYDLPKEKSKEIEISYQDFRKWIYYNFSSILAKNFSPVFTGMYIATKQKDDGSYLVFVWSDSYRLSEYKVKINGGFDCSHSMIIPKSTLIALKSVFAFIPGEKIIVKYVENTALISYETEEYSVLVWVLLIQGNFPDYDNEKIIPRTYDRSLLINIKELKEVLPNIMRVSRDNNYGFDLSVSWENTIMSSDNDTMVYKTKIHSIVKWEHPVFCANASHIKDFLLSNKFDTITFQQNWSGSPILITSDEKNFRLIIRPLKTI